jgi:hypothetical protein
MDIAGPGLLGKYHHQTFEYASFKTARAFNTNTLPRIFLNVSLVERLKLKTAPFGY